MANGVLSIYMKLRKAINATRNCAKQELQLTIDELRLQGKQATKKLIDRMEKGTLLKSKVPFILF